MLKEAAAIIAPVLTELFNNSLEYEEFPKAWQLGYTIPLYKSDDPQSSNNYRLITRLPALSKIFERVIYRHVYGFLRTNNLICKNQSGLVPHDSSVNQLISIVDFIANSLNEGNRLLAAFLDSSKAFDKVSHSGLLVKLRSKGLLDSLIRWFDSYLSFRCIVSMVDGNTSDELSVACGVPQGSILGPLLFLIYIDDLPLSVRSTCKLFADDVSLYITATDITTAVKVMNQDLAGIAAWSVKWVLFLNVKKCAGMVFTLDPLATVPLLVINNIQLDYVDKHTHLGLILAPSLSWKEHHTKKYCTTWDG
ncbi:unnamed protein product [Didymodactylos carnosus]|uniref:Reverse transcriptase domain-containing protein n=1 Tax=Didymodactylos carnosus TaxID=1234261 RepID=A0A815US68_9BILA|nr:unnamed protein product [Didymodactylos carnosus]CAF1519926.1 unnamed protein product [Didymodactylos carnosus]CAF3814092.1 unnamed protein product [Didymodactylos carnosus]CAF4379435.1 unnamed protein product [Didymodactylos carnosus]